MNKATSAGKTLDGIKPISLNGLQAALRNWRSAWIVLVAGLIITALATLYMKSIVENNAEQEFTSHCSEIEKQISERLDDNARILLGGAALFNADEIVTREEWRVFTQHQKVEKNLPGTQGIGFSLLIPRAELTQHIQKIRREGFPQYKLRPDGDRDFYSSIIYLEPFSDRNLRAFGYDMFSEPVRRSAMERARDTDNAALSGKVVLVQETDKEVQAGTLMYAPVFRKGMPTKTVEQRRAAIYGWVYSPYRMNDLIQGIIGNRNLGKEKQLHLQIFDGTQPSIESLLYDNSPRENKEFRSEERFARQITVDFNGQRWTLRFTQTGKWLTAIDYIGVWLILSGGIIMTLLIFFLIRSLLNTRAEAMRKAIDITQQLRESEEKYRIIFNNEIYAICIFDLETLALLDVNDAYARVYGYSREELISGMTIHDITAEHQVSDESTKQAIREGTIFIPFRYHRKKDGTVFPVEIVGGPYIWKGRKVMFALAHDITNRKQAEDALKQTRQNYETFFNTIDEFLFVLDEQGNIIHTNFTVIDRLGYTVDELSGQSVLMVHPPERREEAGRIVGEMLNGLAEFCPVPIVTKSGVQIPVETRVSHGFWDGKPVIFGVTKDISQIRLSEEKFSKLFYINPSICGLSDLDTGKYIEVNEAFYTLLGFNKNEVIGKTAIDLGMLSAETIDAVLLKADSNGNVINAEVHLKAKNGNILHVVLSSENIYVQNEKYRFTIAHDITAQKNAETEKAQLELQNRQLQKSESLGRMAAAIAHHFNNQLGVVIGNLEMAIDEQPSGAQPSRSLTSAMDAAWKSAEMSSLMLTYLGQSFEKVEPLDLSYSCGKILPILKAAMPENVILETNLSAPGPIIDTNTDYMQQILTNLINNAWEAIGKNSGTISLSVKTVPPSEIPTAHRHPIDWQAKDAAYACLEVTDTGCGIEDKAIEQLFDPFFSTKFTGRGMGLAVVLGLVNSHKGVITVESKPVRGSAFRIFFPLATEAPRQPQKEENDRYTTISSPSPSKIEEEGIVLVVEDEEMLRNMAAAMLESFGFTVLKAKDGIEALEVFRQHQSEIQFVLTDLTMPRMNGWETLTALRKLQPNIPVILASGYDLAHVMEVDHSELPQAFLAKPYNLKALRNAISQASEGGKR